jgi:RNA 3'-terminal phosphate cyclase (ATP)
MATGFGQLGVPAQHVGEKAAKRMAGYLASTAAVGPHLADQLLLPMALAGAGIFSTVKPTQHTRTAAAVIAQFLDREFRIEETDGRHLVSVAS